MGVLSYYLSSGIDAFKLHNIEGDGFITLDSQERDSMIELVFKGTKLASAFRSTFR